MFNHRFLSSFPKNRKKFYLFALAFGILFLLSGCKSAQLEALEKEVAVIQLTAGREVSRWIQDKHAGFTGPVYAEMFIQYEPINDYTKKEVYDEIVTILETNGWEGEKCGACSSDSFSASLQQDDYPIPINARVRIISDENLISIRMVHPRP